ncbi:hypothetical protein SIN8267_01334 [Sinobacterium norvegicum]|uniref:Uncharacterized protein n=1 Tax=Sinobacterium norvegicum TaxID=1641715 RepID=A0ABM9ADE7_9GAMM|nr:hypothetical protein [Sinobacterium norvegicum]CAH0991232.1 hypothetical protein SIN8267_01334 [Sinobacterium norvegicum]
MLTFATQTIVVSSFVAMASASVAYAETVVGQAYSQDSFEAVYQELHQRSEQLHSVVYRNNSQAVFAQKDIDYRQGKSAPNIVFRSDHCNESYALTKSVDENAAVDTAFGVEIAMHYSNSCADKRHNQSITLTPPYVIDAGFDHHLRSNLDAVKRRDLSFNYPLPSRFREISLKAKAINCDQVRDNFSLLLNAKNAQTSAREDWQQCIVLRPSNWIIAQLFPPIYLAYNQQQQLAMYAGKSNISNVNGDYEKVVILYSETTEQQQISFNR